MSLDVLNLEAWTRLTDAAREAAAKQVLDRLPHGFVFSGLRTHRMGDQQHTLAFFDWQGAPFALIPGCEEAQLGFDHANPPAAILVLPDGMSVAEWEQIKREHLAGLPDESVMYPKLRELRRVSLAHFLLEVKAVGERAIGLDDPLVMHVVNDLEPGRQRGTTYGGRTVRVRKAVDGQVEAFQQLDPVYKEVQTQISAEGFRLPTSDEWEYACAAGTGTIFRWGNMYPVACLPDEAPCEWQLHRQPNSFGLLIANHAYHWEFTAEFGVMRGGDGGNAICGAKGHWPRG